MTDVDPIDDIADDYTDRAATFGDRIAAARETIGYSQEALARRLGVREDTLRAWEEDRSEPRANKLQMLAGLLNVSIVWLMSGEGRGLKEKAVPGPAEDLAEVLAELREIRSVQQTLAVRTQRLERRLVAMTE